MTAMSPDTKLQLSRVLKEVKNRAEMFDLDSSATSFEISALIFSRRGSAHLVFSSFSVNK